MDHHTTAHVARFLERAVPPTDAVVAAAATFLVNSGPTAWRSLLRVHVPNDSGHCKGCSSSAAASPVWPCTLWHVGDAADQLARRTA